MKDDRQEAVTLPGLADCTDGAAAAAKSVADLRPIMSPEMPPGQLEPDPRMTA